MNLLQNINVIDLLKTTKSIDNAVISNSMVNADELWGIVKSIIYSKPVDGEVVIELGTYAGKTANVIVTALDELGLNNILVSVDCFVHGKNLINHWLLHNKTKNSILVVSDTKTFLNFWTQENAAMIFVDAGHEYEDAHHDILKSMKIIRKGGVIFVDDYNSWSYPEVYKAVNDLLKNNEEFKPLITSSLFVAYERII